MEVKPFSKLRGRIVEKYGGEVELTEQKGIFLLTFVLNGFGGYR